MRRLFLLLFTCCLFPSAIAQEAEPEKTNSLYESVFVPDRTLTRRLEQVNRLYEAGRTNETAQLLGNILETANFAFITPEQKEEEKLPRTLHQTVNDYIIDRLRRLPKEARDSYAFQFEPTARRLLDNAAAAGSLDDVQEVARKYFPTASGASATFLIGLTQFERGDYTDAFLTLDRLQRLHPAIPDALKPALDKTLAESKALSSSTAGLPQRLAESTWLEHVGWRIPTGSPSHNFSTKATAPLLEKNWTVPVFNRLSWERETDTLARMIKSRDDVYIPASQPLVVGNLFVTRTPGETIAVDALSGKRLWGAAESEYRNPDGNMLSPRPTPFMQNLRTALRLYFWHDRIAQQLSSDGERLFTVDEHDLHGIFQSTLGRALPSLQGRGEDPRYAPGSTLTARDLKTGQILWQVGKFPYAQKAINDMLAPRPRNAPAGQVAIDETIFTDDEKALRETWFLGAPLPLLGRLYVIGETDGTIQLYALDPQTGRLIARQPFAQAADSIVLNTIRRTYPLFPSASGGIVICPTGSGLIVALDAATLTPLWCYSYSPATRTVEPNNRNAINALRQRQLPLLERATSEDAIRQLFAESGWQVPSIIIDQHRVLVAPPDQAALYCLDMLTGELLWEQTVSRSNSLYVACVHNDRAFLVTPVNIMTIDMNTGENFTHTENLESRFPKALKPAGVGVRSGGQYFIPFTDGHLAVVDLNDSTLTWLDASGAAIVPIAEEEIASGINFLLEADDELPPNLDFLDRMRAVDPPVGQPVQPFEFPAGAQINRRQLQIEGRIVIDGQQVVIQQGFGGIDPFGTLTPIALSNTSPNLAADDVFQQPIQFGNLVGIKGRFFSQSPTQISSFDQKEPLRQRAEELLQADANDPEGLLKQGRILKSEGKLTEAIEAFRASLKAKHTVEAADALRRNLLEAIRKDYPAWAHASEELESLAEFPDEWGAILHAQIEGVLQSGSRDDLVAILEKVFAFGQNHSMLIPVSSDHSAQLHRALGCLVEQSIVRNPGLKATWEELAEMFLYHDSSAAAPRGAQANSFQWFRSPAYLPPEVQRWSMFTKIFRNTAAAERAKEMLRAEYIRHRLPIALDLQERQPVLSWSELPAPLVWRPKVEVQVVPVSAALNQPDLPPVQGDGANRAEIDRIVSRLVANVQNPTTTRPNENPAPILFLGASESETVAFNHFIRQGTSGFFFCRTDLAGRELWRLALPPTVSSGYQDAQASNRYNGEYTTYLKGFRHFLLLVHGNSLTAIDTAPQSEKILWSKTLSAVPISQLTGTRMNNPNQRPNLGVMTFPRNAVVVSPHAVCYWEANSIYGLDPLTGQTLWVRRILYENCTLLGDDEHLFAAFPEVRQVISIDPASGRELDSGTFPASGVYVYGTNIVFMQQRGNNWELLMSDLRDMHDRRKRALQASDAPPGTTPTILVETLHSAVRGTSMLQTFRNDRFLSVATWDTKMLQVYDLQTKKKLLPDDNKILEFVPQDNVSMSRCDVELVGDRILVLFTKNTQFRNTQEPQPDEDGTSVRRNYRMVNGVVGFPTDSGVMMLFDSSGEPCWSEPMVIEKWYRLLDVPDSLPVMLFAVAFDDTVIANTQRLYGVRLKGIDKRSGERLFRTRLTAESVPMQPFRVSVDVPAQEIIFTNSQVNPPRTVKAVFVDE